MARPNVAHITAYTPTHHLLARAPHRVPANHKETQKCDLTHTGRGSKEGWREKTQGRHKSKQHHLSTVSLFSDCDPASRAERQTPYLNLLWRDFLIKTCCLGFRKFIDCTFRKYYV